MRAALAPGHTPAVRGNPASAALDSRADPAGLPPARRNNAAAARRLDEVAGLLEQQGANVHRVRAYRAAAQRLRDLEVPAAEILREEGLEGLERLPDIGPVIARAIRSMVTTGRLPILDRLRGEMDPERLLASVPGIGSRLAARLHDRNGIATLEDLEAAAESGRLAAIAGFGEKRLAGIRDTLATRLARIRVPAGAPAEPVPVSELLDVDAEYLRRSTDGDLPRIAPRRFNPEGKAWLPVLHTERGGRHYTALYSNTERAHRLGRTSDWVVLFHDGPEGESRQTVVTERQGPLRGRRIVRGREEECARFYAERPLGGENARRTPKR